MRTWPGTLTLLRTATWLLTLTLRALPQRSLTLRPLTLRALTLWAPTLWAPTLWASALRAPARLFALLLPASAVVVLAVVSTGRCAGEGSISQA